MIPTECDRSNLDGLNFGFQSLKGIMGDSNAEGKKPLTDSVVFQSLKGIMGDSNATMNGHEQRRVSIPERDYG